MRPSGNTGGVSIDPVTAFGVHLTRTDDRSGEVIALADRWGGRVGLPGVLAHLDRTAGVGPVPAPAATWGFRLHPQDDRSRRWFPQGITTSADAHASGRVLNRSLLITTAYSRQVNDLNMGTRITVTDISDPGRVRYRHVLLVEAVAVDGRLTLRPVRVHAGGVVWYGRNLHVAATNRGLCTFRLDDILPVPGGGAVDRLDVGEGSRPHAFGYRYVLPLRFRYAAAHAPAVRPIRYSFASLDRTSSPPRLFAGEYGRDGASTRIVRYQVDPGTTLLEEDRAGRSAPLGIEIGIEGMQGVAVVDGRHYVCTSAGRRRRGSLWSGLPGSLRKHTGVLPVGPEDLAYWPERDQLWSLSEHPDHRWVYAMDRTQFD